MKTRLFITATLAAAALCSTTSTTLALGCWRCAAAYAVLAAAGASPLAWAWRAGLATARVETPFGVLIRAGERGPSARGAMLLQELKFLSSRSLVHGAKRCYLFCHIPSNWQMRK